ncbi:hypothetical protein M413DRAFT_443710 [Hebeloma cylindrosporum]|uniref:Uncharacterized protein n=1 Tax=Hebeloma cylindrosporum TaxID=76867 RepID=A0A0C3C4P1_HEBCY|nr:hypothetical protein M413DRAFT_443710 [Hebeloma cylindrosporum h7]
MHVRHISQVTEMLIDLGLDPASLSASCRCNSALAGIIGKYDSIENGKTAQLLVFSIFTLSAR